VKKVRGDTMQKTVLIAALIISLLMIPFLVHTEVYRWVDEKGTVHFTDDNSRVPEKYGQQVEKRSFSEDPKPMTEEKKQKTRQQELLSPALVCGKHRYCLVV